MEPFTLHYTLTRRQRAEELIPWVPAIAGSVGYAFGVAFLAIAVSAWFVCFLLLPVVFYRSLFGLLFELAFRPSRPVEVRVDGDVLTVRAGDARRQLPLDGIIQVVRSGDSWTVLHLSGSSLTIPGHAITPDQVDFLKSFARRAAAERRAARGENAS